MDYMDRDTCPLSILIGVKPFFLRMILDPYIFDPIQVLVFI